MELNVHIRIVNGTENDLKRLNLYTIVERLEEGQSDIVNVYAGGSFDLIGYTPAPEALRKRFNAAVNAAGSTPGTEGNEGIVYYQTVTSGA